MYSMKELKHVFTSKALPNCWVRKSGWFFKVELKRLWILSDRNPLDLR